jgi:hypothetical protein
MTSTTSLLSMILPDTLMDVFGEDAETGCLSARVYSAVAAREIERSLAEASISYQTRIIRSRKRGIYYQIAILGGDFDGT